MHDELIAVRPPREQERIDARNCMHLTPDSRLQLAVWLTDPGNRRWPELVALLQEPEHDGRTVAEYEASCSRQRNGRASSKRRLSRRGIPAPSMAATTWEPAHAREAFVDNERIPVTAPVGSALMGAKSADGIRVKAPQGAVNCSIQSIEPMTMEVVA